MTCAFFGHRNCPKDVFYRLKETIIELIENKGVTRFLVGNNGNFDRLVIKALNECKVAFPHIDYCVVLAYLPNKKDFEYPTLFPESLEAVPKKYAICKRNNWMIKNSDFAVFYVSRNFGGAYKSLRYAEKLGITCINIT